MIRFSSFVSSVVLLVAFASCCIEDDDGNCTDGCTKNAEQGPCSWASEVEQGRLKILHSGPEGYDSLVIELHASSAVETSEPYLVLRPANGSEWSELVANGAWSARAIYWKEGRQTRVYDGTSLSSGRIHGCTCYDYTQGVAWLDLLDED